MTILLLIRSYVKCKEIPLQLHILKSLPITCKYTESIITLCLPQSNFLHKSKPDASTSLFLSRQYKEVLQSLRLPE